MIHAKYPITYAFAIAFLVSAVAAPFLYRLLLKLNSRQTISEHVQEHAHKQGTPTMGGIIFLLGWLVSVFLIRAEYAFNVLALVLFFGAIGFIDDYVVPKVLQGKRGLGWKQKLLLQIGFTVGLFYFNGQPWPTIALGTFMILFFSNAYNFADGMDALAGTIAVMVAIGLGIMALWADLGHIALHMGALIGAFLPFLFLNAPPAKVFMGDVGALPVGALLGHQMLEISLRTPTLSWQLYIVPMSVLAFVLIAELVPVPIQIASVKLTGKRVFPRTPIHHAFQHAGWPETRVVWLFALVQGLCLLISLSWVYMLHRGALL